MTFINITRAYELHVWLSLAYVLAGAVGFYILAKKVRV